MEKSVAVAKINNVEIVVIRNGSEMVPVKPICEALGIDFSSQLQKLKNDEILGSTVVMNTTVGADEKNREMVTIPLKFVFGWLFTIDPSRVKPEAKEIVIKYKLACYEALYEYFIGAAVEIKESISDTVKIQREQDDLANKLYKASPELFESYIKTFDKLRESKTRRRNGTKTLFEEAKTLFS